MAFKHIRSQALTMVMQSVELMGSHCYGKTRVAFKHIQSQGLTVEVKIFRDGILQFHKDH